MVLYYPQALPLFQNSAPRILTPYFCAVVLIQFVVGQWDVSVNEQSIAWMHPRTRAPWRCCFVVNRLAVTVVTDFFFDKRPLSDSLQAMVPFQYLCTCSSSIFGRVMTCRSIRRRVSVERVGRVRSWWILNSSSKKKKRECYGDSNSNNFIWKQQGVPD